MPPIKPLLALGACCACTALVLILVLVPLHFTYVDRQMIAFKRDVIGGKVDRSRVYTNGRYGWGVAKGKIQFNATYTPVRARDLTVFTDAGEIKLSVVFYYRLDPARLGALYDNFGPAYHERIESIAISELRNAATRFTIQQYQEERAVVVKGMYDHLASVLPSRANIDIDRNFFFLEHVHLPEAVLEKKMAIFEQTQLLITQNVSAEAKLIRYGTDRDVNTITNKASITKANAVRVAQRMRLVAQWARWSAVQAVTGFELAKMGTDLEIDGGGDVDKEKADLAAMNRYNLIFSRSGKTTLLDGLKSVVIGS